MNYIIDPMWFYWVNVVDSLRVIGEAAGIISGIAAAVLFVLAAFAKTIDDDDDGAKKFAKIGIRLGVITAISVALVVFIPSKQTLIEMQIARFATYENAEWTVETIKQAVDYIVEAVGSLK